MRYAYTLAERHFIPAELKDHKTKMYLKTHEDIRAGFYKKDYVVPFKATRLDPVLQDWLKQFNVNYSLKSYYTMDRVWSKMEGVWHYIEFDDDQARMLFKLAWHKV